MKFQNLKTGNSKPYKRIALLSLVLTVNFISLFAKEIVIASPDKKIVFKLSVLNELRYTALFKGRPVCNSSIIGGGLFPAGLPVISTIKRTIVDRQMHLTLMDNDHYREKYNEVRVGFTKDKIPFALICRVYNEGVAFRYVFTNKRDVYREEITEFNFAGNPVIYQQDKGTVTNGCESPYHVVSLAEMKGTAELPLTVKTACCYALINEASNDNFSRVLLQKNNEQSGIRTFLWKPVSFTKQQVTSPWRYILMANTAVELANHYPVIYSLCPPTLKKDVSWIKPGKAIRDVTLTTAGAMACIDFCKRMNMQYILFDAGWYGLGYGMKNEHNPLSDAKQVVPAIDMPKVIAYGKENGIGVLLYVNFVALRTYLDELLPLYKSWGVAGLKFGFVDGRTQAGIQFIYDAVRKAAQHKLVVDIHDDFRPTGLSRTYPNLLTQEGIRGNENMPDAFNNTILPFSRMLTGAADYTICYPSEAVKDPASTTNEGQRSKLMSLPNTRGHQLALSVLYFSPLQLLFWYGKPAFYEVDGVETEFFKSVPVVWNESKTLAGEPGLFATTARRLGKDWFIGSITNKEKISYSIPLDFLQAGKKYIAIIYDDDGKGSITKKQLTVSKGNRLQVNLMPSGGQAIHIIPIH